MSLRREVFIRIIVLQIVFTHVVRSYANFLEQRHFFTLQKCQSPTDVYLYTNMAAVFIVLYTNMATVTSGENDLLPRKALIETKNRTLKCLKRFSHDVTKVQTKSYRSYRDFTFTMYQSSGKLIFIQIFASKGFSVQCWSTLEFLSFCVTRHLHEGQESGHVG